MAARRRAPRAGLTHRLERLRPERQPDAGAAVRVSGGRGRHRRVSTYERFLAWAGLVRRGSRERQLFEAELRELRLATAILRAEVSILRQELEQARVLAAERADDAARVALLLPLLQRAFAAAADERERVYLGFSPDVKHLVPRVNGTTVPAGARDVIDLEPERVGGGSKGGEIVLPLVPAGPQDDNAGGGHAARRTA